MFTEGLGLHLCKYYNWLVGWATEFSTLEGSHEPLARVF